MQVLPAKQADSTQLEDLGRATLHIVHDLKNQLNGLKLYATFLRKRMERDERPQDECETVAKLIAGLDRAAHDLTALVRYAEPVQLRCRQHVDLSKIISKAVDESNAGLSVWPSEISVSGAKAETFLGDFDAPALIGAFKTLIEQANGTTQSLVTTPASFTVRRDDTSVSQEVLIEWRGVNCPQNQDLFRALDSVASVRLALATRTIEAHGGRIEHDANCIRVWLPLTN